MAFNPNPYPLLFLFVLLNSTSLVLLFAASAPSSFSSLRVSPSPRLQEYISRGRNLVQLVIPPCVGRRSRRKRLRSRGEYRREIITTALYAAGEISREFRWKFYLFQAGSPPTPGIDIYAYIRIFLRSFHASFPSSLSLQDLSVFFLVAEIRSTMPPMINEKVVYMSARLKDTVVIPCVAYGNPTPTNR